MQETERMPLGEINQDWMSKTEEYYHKQESFLYYISATDSNTRSFDLLVHVPITR